MILKVNMLSLILAPIQHIKFHISTSPTITYTITFEIHSTRTQIQKVILYSKSGLNVRFKDFSGIKKIKPSKIWYDKFN